MAHSLLDNLQRKTRQADQLVKVSSQEAQSQIIIDEDPKEEGREGRIRAPTLTGQYQCREEDSEGGEERVEIKDKKRSLTVIKSVIPSKKRRLVESSSEDDLSDDEDDNDDVLDTGLSLGDDEDLALKLLSQ